MTRDRKHGSCFVCGRRIPEEFAGQPFHSQACARLLLQRVLAAVPDVLKLLPPAWQGVEPKGDDALFVVFQNVDHAVVPVCWRDTEEEAKATATLLLEGRASDDHSWFWVMKVPRVGRPRR